VTLGSATLPTRAALLLLALATLALVFRVERWVAGSPFTEDAFYSMAVARNVAAGVGVTADGVRPTNGFQPLFTFVQAGLFRLAGDDALAMRLSTALSWAIWLVTLPLVGRLARDALDDGADQRERRQWLAAGLYGAGFLTFMHHFNGLETGLLMLLYATLARGWQRGWFLGRAGPARLGLLLGLAVLTRIDAAVFAAIVGAWLALREARARPMAGLLAAAQVGVIAFLVSAPWWAFNLLEFGRLMPTSGTAQQEWAINERRLRWIFWAMANCLLPGLWLGKAEEWSEDGIPLSALRAAIILTLVWWARRLWPAGKTLADLADTTRRTVEFGLLMAMTFGLLALYYGFSFIAYWFYYRYFFPVAIPASVAIATLLVAGIPAGRRWHRPAMALPALLALPTLISAVMAQQGRTLHLETVYWEQLALVAERVPATDEVAAGQTGTLGFFRQGVVNVDGKVNRDAIPHQDAMWEYLRARGVRWFVDWPYYVEKYLGRDPAANGWVHTGQKGYWQLWEYQGRP
jgi:hypothetical protein